MTRNELDKARALVLSLIGDIRHIQIMAEMALNEDEDGGEDKLVAAMQTHHRHGKEALDRYRAEVAPLLDEIAAANTDRDEFVFCGSTNDIAFRSAITCVNAFAACAMTDELSEIDVERFCSFPADDLQRIEARIRKEHAAAMQSCSTEDEKPRTSASPAQVEELTQRQLSQQTGINTTSLAKAAKAAGLKPTGHGQSAVYKRRDWLAMANAHADKVKATPATILKWNEFLAKHDAGQIGIKPKASKR